MIRIPQNQLKTVFAILLATTLFFACNNDFEPKPIPEEQPKISIANGVYAGAVGFNDSTYEHAVTDTFSKVKTFVSGLKNDRDATALCYGISQGINLLKDAEDLTNIDYAFIVSFTDGFDNYSGALFDNVYQNQVVGHTVDLLKNARVNGNKIKSYTLGLQGDGTLKENDLKSLAVNGEYILASAETLEETFEKIADNVIDAAKDISIVTNNVPIPKSSPKLLQIEIRAYVPNDTDTNSYFLEAEFYNENNDQPALLLNSISDEVDIIVDTDDEIAGQKVIYGQVNGSKITIPLSNLTISNGVNELHIEEIIVRTRFSSTEEWVEDVEDSKAEAEVLNNIAIVLVLDCSKSIGSEFASIKIYANNFIDKLAGK